MAIDTNGAAVLIHLDLSAAFDTINHQILLDHLEKAFGLKDDALLQMKSYTWLNAHSVVINEALPSYMVMEFDFPHGAVLDPKNFKRYSAAIGVSSQKQGLCFHLYADDTQLYVTFSPTNPLDQ